jgi:hypothetical protein
MDRSLVLKTAVLVTVLVVGWDAAGRIQRARARDQYAMCRRNEMRIGTALEMYSTEFQGRYPPRLALLLPKYLTDIPTCPAGGRDTYSDGYRCASVNSDGRGHGYGCDAYTVVCLGGNHPIGVPAPDSQEERISAKYRGLYATYNPPVVSSLGVGWHTGH